MNSADAFEHRPRTRIRPGTVVVGLLLLAAIVVVATVWSQQGGSAAEHLLAGHKYMQMNRGAEAEREWKEAAHRDPENAEAWALLAQHYMRTEDYEAAIEPLRELARLKPGMPQVLDRLATSASRVGDPVRILRGAEESLQRNPEDTGALAIAVKLLAKSDDEQKRLTYLRRMVQLRPNDVNHLILLARTLTNAHLYDEASPLVERILKLDPKSVDGYGLRGRRRLDTGTSLHDLELAEADFQKALALNPRGPMIHLQLGKLYLRRGQPDRAVTHLESAARLQPDQAEVFFVLTSAYAQAGQSEKADSARSRFAELRQENDEASSLEKRCAADPDDFDIHLRAGLLALKRGDLDKGDYFLNRAQNLQPGDPRARKAFEQLAALAGQVQTGREGPPQ